MGNFFDDEKSGIETDNREKLFEDVKHTDEDGEEYWLARELQEVLQYKAVSYTHLRAHET